MPKNGWNPQYSQMKITDILTKSNETLFSLEILPPKKGGSIDHLYKLLDPLMEFNPPFIDVTYHREEYVYKKRGKKLLEKQIVRKRPGTVGICAAIKNHYDVETVPHIICGGFSKEETENALIELNFLGIDNILVLRGDPVKSEQQFVADENGHQYASELLQQVIDLNHGIYLDEDLENSSKTNFCVGVAGYPEKHAEAPSIRQDIKYLKRKIDLGADYIVTQMFFDNQKYFEFVKKCRDADIHVPIIPGLKPLTTLRHLKILPQMFHIDVPDDLVDAVSAAKSNKQVMEIGKEWCIQQSKELKSAGVPVLHYYTMSRSSIIHDIAQKVF